MTFQPLIYFAVFISSQGKPTIFGEFESSEDCYYTLGTFNGYDSSYDRVEIVWFDLETNLFYKYTTEIKLSSRDEKVYFMIVAEGVALIWIGDGVKTIVKKNFNCDKITLTNLSEYWVRMLETKTRYYKANNEDLSLASHSFSNVMRESMRDYEFRFFPVVDGEKEIDLLDIRQYLSDGTVTTLDDKSLFLYQHASKPQKLAVNWTIDDSLYSAYFWLNEERNTAIFERFYGAHPDTKSDFIIRIDAENKKYELSLYRQGLKEPVVIPESAYQLIVFKNKFEDYRSENYNQPSGAWIW